jgi:prefoldin subunit 5
MSKPTVASPVSKKVALKEFIAKSNANIDSLEKEASRLGQAADKIGQDTRDPLTDDQKAQIKALRAAEHALDEKIKEYSAIESMELNSPAIAKGLKDQIDAINKDLTGTLKKLDKTVKTINSVKAVIDGLTALLNAAAAVTKLFA